MRLLKMLLMAVYASAVVVTDKAKIQEHADNVLTDDRMTGQDLAMLDATESEHLAQKLGYS